MPKNRNKNLACYNHKCLAKGNCQVYKGETPIGMFFFNIHIIKREHCRVYTAKEELRGRKSKRVRYHIK